MISEEIQKTVHGMRAWNLFSFCKYFFKRQEKDDIWSFICWTTFFWTDQRRLSNKLLASCPTCINVLVVMHFISNLLGVSSRRYGSLGWLHLKESWEIWEWFLVIDCRMMLFVTYLEVVQWFFLNVSIAESASTWVVQYGLNQSMIQNGYLWFCNNLSQLRKGTLHLRKCKGSWQLFLRYINVIQLFIGHTMHKYDSKCALH